MIVIRPFAPEYQAGVIDLILPIQQQEFGIAITLQDQPDLLDIPGFYQQQAGNFWLVLADSTVVGCVALLDIGDGLGALRKMFVAAPYRGKQYGLGRRLLDTLLAWSERHEIREIYLGTTAQFVAAQHFYRKNGFDEIAKNELPAGFPVMAVDSMFFMRRVNSGGR